MYNRAWTLAGEYDGKQSYFVAHLIEKMAEWGPYKKSNKLKLSSDDLKLIESYVSNKSPITWDRYEKVYAKNGCPEHKNANAQVALPPLIVNQN